MEHWNLAVCRTRRGEQYYLTNRARTLVKINRHLRHFDPLEVFVRLQELGVPETFTRGLNEIYFTVLRGKSVGWHFDDQIIVDVSSQWTLDEIVKTLIHELGHHVDEQDNISRIGHLTEERLTRGAKLEELKRFRTNALDDDEEYLASGFEQFYAGGREGRSHLRRSNPKLYHTISRIDRIYRSDHS